MLKSVCGADCESCGFGKNNGCKGCIKSNGCPLGKKCFIFDYIKIGGKENFEQFKKELICEFNSLNISGMPKIEELYAINGAFVNLTYTMPNGESFKLLDDNSVYLGTQKECEFNDGDEIRCFGLVAGPEFLLVSEYGKNCISPELLVYRKR